MVKPMFTLINESHEKKIKNLLKKIELLSTQKIAGDLLKIIEIIRNDIPEKKKISYGRYNILKSMGIFMYPLMEEMTINIPSFCKKIYNDKKIDPFVRSLSIQIYSFYGEKKEKLTDILKIFELAATDDQWEVRECSAGFIRKLIKKYPKELHSWYLKMVRDENPMKRRFASESIRPVADNKYFQNNPDFVFSIIKNLYFEPVEYPRTSVGNSLSDWMRINEELTLPIVKELAANGDKNSYWIAYRACRNLVKKEPLMVMDILKTNKYIYKDRKFYRKDFESSFLSDEI